MRSTRCLALILALAPSLTLAAPSSMKQELANAQQRLERNGFMTTRELPNYGAMLSRPRVRRGPPPTVLRTLAQKVKAGYARLLYDVFDIEPKSKPSSFERFVRRLPADAVWLDAGAGYAAAPIQYLAHGGKATVVALGVKRPEWDTIDEMQKTQRFRYLEGRYVEDYSAEELRTHFGAASGTTGEKKANLITDLFGPLSYTTKPHEVLQRYFDVLEKGGFLFSYVQDERSKVKGANGKQQLLAEWIATIPGLEVKSMPGDSGALVIRKVADHIEVPPLTMIDFKDDHPPLRKFEAQR